MSWGPNHCNYTKKITTIAMMAIRIRNEKIKLPLFPYEFIVFEEHWKGSADNVLEITGSWARLLDIRIICKNQLHFYSTGTNNKQKSH